MAQKRRPLIRLIDWLMAVSILVAMPLAPACAPSCLWVQGSCLLVTIDSADSDRLAVDSLLLTLESTTSAAEQSAEPLGPGPLPRQLRLEPPPNIASHEVKALLVRANIGSASYETRMPLSWPDGEHIETTLILGMPLQNETPDMGVVDLPPLVLPAPPLRLDRFSCLLPADGVDVVVSDWDGDQIPDVAALAGDTLLTMRGPFVGTSCVQASYAVASGPVGLVAADFYADGYPDLVVASRAGDTLQSWKNQGNGTFSLAYSASLSSPPTRVVGIHADADRWMDVGVISGAEHGTMAIFRSQGNGSFTSPTSYPTASGQPVLALSVALQPDWFRDVIVAHNLTPSSGQDPVQRLPLGSSGGITPTLLALGDRPTGLAAGPLFATKENSVAIRYHRELVLLKNDGLGAFSGAPLRVPIELGGLERGLAAGDFDHDGLVDLVLLEEGEIQGDGQVRFVMQKPPGVFTLTSPLWTGGDEPRAITVADMNGDGRPELVIVHARTRNLTVLTPLPIPAG